MRGKTGGEIRHVWRRGRHEPPGPAGDSAGEDIKLHDLRRTSTLENREWIQELPFIIDIIALNNHDVYS